MTSTQTTIITKLAELRKEVSGFVKKEKNDHFKNSYYNIDQMIDVLQPKLEEKGLMLTQPMVVQDSENVLKTVVIDIESGNEKELCAIIVGKSDNPQKVGSSMTYYRRYSLASYFFWGAVDDDGNDGAGILSQQDKKMIDSAKNIEELREIFNTPGKGESFYAYATEVSKKFK